MLDPELENLKIQSVCFVLFCFNVMLRKSRDIHGIYTKKSRNYFIHCIYHRDPIVSIVSVIKYV